MSNDWSQRPNKDVQRQLIFDLRHGFARPQQHAAILMPGWDDGTQTAGYDIRLGLEHGSLRKDREIIAVERDQTTASLIKSDLQKVGLQRLRMHTNSLHTLNLTNTQVDFAFIDFLGSFTSEDILWMHRTLRPSLTVGARLAITVAVNPLRNNTMMESLRRCIEVGKYPMLTALSTPFSAAMKRVRQSSKNTLPSDGFFIAPLMLVIAALHNREVKPEVIQPYRDGKTTMMTMRFTVGREIQSSYSPLGEILQIANSKKRILVDLPVDVSPPAEGEGPLVRIGDGKGGFQATARTRVFRQPCGRLEVRLVVNKGGKIRITPLTGPTTDRGIRESEMRRARQDRLVAEGFIEDDVGTILQDLPEATAWAAGEIVTGMKIGSRSSRVRKCDVNHCWMLVKDKKHRSLAQWMAEAAENTMLAA